MKKTFLFGNCKFEKKKISSENPFFTFACQWQTLKSKRGGDETRLGTCSTFQSFQLMYQACTTFIEIHTHVLYIKTYPKVCACTLNYVHIYMLQLLHVHTSYLRTYMDPVSPPPKRGKSQFELLTQAWIVHYPGSRLLSLTGKNVYHWLLDIIECSCATTSFLIFHKKAVQSSKMYPWSNFRSY